MHTHWDREWYFTKDETKVFLLNHMIEVVDFLEQNSDVKYVLDGQSVMLDDFLLFAPHYESRLRVLTQKGQLLVGPWYTQTDLMIVHGEMIIKNLYYGIKRAKEFGQPMLNGYTPDTFGHNPQMPQIYKDFGIDNTIFWRGFSELKASKSDFLWEGVDGSLIYGINLATGYQGAKYLESDYDELQERTGKIMKVLDNYSATDARLIMNGHDQMPIQKDIHDIIDKMQKMYPEDKISISSFDEYLESVRGMDLEKVSGELVHSKHARIHKTINSTRMDIKLLNSYLERKIFNELEPLLVKGSKNNIEYPHELMAYIYKILFGVHAHDSIGGCNSDQVNQDIKQELIRVKDIVDNQIQLTLRLIANNNIDTKDILVFNPLPYERENANCSIEIFTDNSDFALSLDGTAVDYVIYSQGAVDAGLIDRQVAARLKDIQIYKTMVEVVIPKMAGFETKVIQLMENEKVNENNTAEPITIGVNDGEVTLNNNGKVTKNFISIVNSADAGDSYDYSPPVNDKVFVLSNYKLISKANRNNISTYKFEVTATLPYNMESRLTSAEVVEQTFKIDFVINQLTKVIQCNFKAVNQLCDSRFRVCFNTECFDETVEVDMQLSKYIRNIYAGPELAVWEKENWAEKPVSIETCNSLVKYGEYAYITDGLREYEIVDGKLFFTLFRSFSHLGKRNLVNRPGRPSGIEIETPDNQLLGAEFDINLFIYLGDKNPHVSSKEALSPMLTYQLKEYNRFNVNKSKATNTFSFELATGDLVVSSVRNTTENDIAIRLFNPTNEDITLEHKGYYLSNMLEEKLEQADSSVVGPNKIITLIKE